MKIAIGCDHGGFEHKNAIAEHLKGRGFTVEDFGIYENRSVDYPEIALKVANSIKNGENELGILVCGTGIGMALELADLFVDTEYEGGRHQRRLDMITEIEKSQN